MTQPVCDPGDLERHAGEAIPDPWDDPAQTDWPDQPTTGRDTEPAPIGWFDDGD